MAGKTLSRGKQNAVIIDINKAVGEYVESKNMLDVVTKRVNTMKANIRAFVESHGSKDEKGHLWLEVEGVDGVSSVKIERRVGTSVDHDKAERWLKEHGMWNDCSVLIPAHRELDEDKLLALGFERKIPKKIFDGFIVTNESFAFKTV